MSQRAKDWLKKADQNLLVDIFDRSESDREWYCHLLFIHRRKCLLFTHSITLFSFLIADVRVADLRNFASLFRTQARNALTLEGVTPTQVAYLLDAGPDQVAKSINRSVIGSMNDMARMYKYYVEDAGSLGLLDVGELNREINKAPMSYIGMESGARALKDFLKARGVE
jgi:hypothetical protein